MRRVGGPGLLARAGDAPFGLQAKKGGIKASTDDLSQRLVTSADIRALTQDSYGGGDAPGARDIFTTRLSDAVAVLGNKISENGSPPLGLDYASSSQQDEGSEYAPGVGGMTREGEGGAGAGGAAHMDELSLLMTDTPLAKLRAKEEELKDLEAGGEGADPWRLVRVQQELLALAKLHTQLHRRTDHRPLLVPTAHFQLAQRYSDLGCVAQASEHLQRSIDELPAHGQSRPEVRELMRKVHVCMAEALLKSEPPKPQVALQHLLTASGKQTLEEVAELELVVLVSQAHALLGDTKLSEARGTRLARNRLALALDELDVSARKAEASKRVLELANLRQRMSDTENEARAEEEYEVQLVEQAKQLFDQATETLYDVTQRQEQELEVTLGGGRKEMRRHPLVHSLRRQLCALSVKLADCYGLSDNTVDQERSLGEVISTQATYECVPLGMRARVLKELGVTKMKNKKYDEALEVFDQLRELQEERYAEDYVQKELAVAECYKLSGDVFVAMREFSRAHEHFDSAYGKYLMELGPMHQLTQDLEHRMRELEQYTEMAVPLPA